jgi:hypothetical protein
VYILDTNTVSNFLDASRQNDLLRQRILQTSPDERFITVITVEEMIVRGAIPALNTARQRGGRTYSPTSSASTSSRTAKTLTARSAGFQFRSAIAAPRTAESPPSRSPEASPSSPTTLETSSVFPA